MKKHKNLFCLFSVLVIIAVTSGCSEYRVRNREYGSGNVDDNYRVYYEIFVGAFSDTNSDGIGDLRGVVKRLDYLNDGKPASGRGLGIEGIWLMPIMPSPSYHKYDVEDYYGIDPLYGTMEDMESLIAECNKRGIKVIIDLVLNHTSSEHPWFKAAKDAIREGDLDNRYAKYYVKGTSILAGRTWHRLERTPEGTQYFYEGNFSPVMPELDIDNPDVRNEIIDIAKFWLEKGVGGFRLDAVRYFYYREDRRNIQFLKWFNDECRKIRGDVYIVAENWTGNPSIQDYYEAVNCFDFGMSGTNGDIYYTAQGINSVTEFASRLALYQKQVLDKNPLAILNPFISNHDMDRAADFLDVQDYSMHTAASLYILSSGSPFVYYGEEIGMKGSRGSEQTDANRRLAMLWGDNDTVADPEGSTYDGAGQTNGSVKDQLPKKDSLVTHYKKLIRLRKANPEIARGIIAPLDFSHNTNFGGFVSNYNDSRVAVFHNTGERDITVDLAGYTDMPFTVVRGYAGRGTASLNGSVLTLSGYTSAVLK